MYVVGHLNAIKYTLAPRVLLIFNMNLQEVLIFFF